MPQWKQKRLDSKGFGLEVFWFHLKWSEFLILIFDMDLKKEKRGFFFFTFSQFLGCSSGLETFTKVFLIVHTDAFGLVSLAQ